MVLLALEAPSLALPESDIMSVDDGYRVGCSGEEWFVWWIAWEVGVVVGGELSAGAMTGNDSGKVGREAGCGVPGVLKS